MYLTISPTKMGLNIDIQDLRFGLLQVDHGYSSFREGFRPWDTAPSQDASPVTVAVWITAHKAWAPSSSASPGEEKHNGHPQAPSLAPETSRHPLFYVVFSPKVWLCKLGTMIMRVIFVSDCLACQVHVFPIPRSKVHTAVWRPLLLDGPHLWCAGLGSIQATHQTWRKLMRLQRRLVHDVGCWFGF